MVDLQFLVINNTNEEISMGMQYSFHSFDRDIKYDAISATANTGGFTPLTSIARYYRWDSKIINKASKQCNDRKEIAVLNNLSPMLLMVPQTRGQNNDSFLISDLLNACSATKTKILRFTHYCFIQNRIPEKEIEIILNYIKDKSEQSGLDTIIWDIDSRHKNQLAEIYKKVFENDCSFI